MTHVCQALFLSYCVGEEQVRLVGEPDNGQKIQLVSPLDLSDAEYDVAFSSDSLTEMSMEQAKQYIEYARERSPVFYSINHEANEFTVASLFQAIRHRYPYWLRKGYIEELFPLDH